MNDEWTKKILDFENNIYQSFFENTQKFLTHYTSFKGLDGILKSKSLWFSSYRFLNDESEGKIINEVLDSVLDECKEIDNDEFKKSIKEVIPTNSNESSLIRFLSGKKIQKHKMIKEFSSVVFPRIMIVCLCGIIILKIKIVKVLI